MILVDLVNGRDCIEVVPGIAGIGGHSTATRRGGNATTVK